MTKLYHQAEGWTVPGKQGAGAERHDVPNSPEQLADWLNARRVPPQPLASAWARDVQLAGEPYAHNAAMNAAVRAGLQPSLEAAAAVLEPAGGELPVDRHARETAEAHKPTHPGQCPRCSMFHANAAQWVQREKAEALAHFIEHEALPGQVEELFVAIGRRFHKLRKEAGK